MRITILCTDQSHPVLVPIRVWIGAMEMEGHSLDLVFNKSELCGGDVLFLVSCSQIIGLSDREKYSKTMVLHASDLPKGRGWSPHIWTIINGGNEIVVSLVEADDRVDTGKIWLKTKFSLSGHELLSEINKKLFEAELFLMTKFISEASELAPQKQMETTGKYMPKRTPADSQLDPHKTIVEQFNLLRVVDNSRYPAFFDYQGIRYTLKIEKVEND